MNFFNFLIIVIAHTYWTEGNVDLEDTQRTVLIRNKFRHPVVLEYNGGYGGLYMVVLYYLRRLT